MATSKRKARQKPKRAYDATSRREAAERTTAEIVAAASALLETMRPESIAYSDVAERAGVAVRTVYRHFPEPKDLLRAVAVATTARFMPTGPPATREQGTEQLAAFHRLLSAEPALFRVFMAAPIRAEVNMDEVVRTAFAGPLGELPEPARKVAVPLVELMLSPFAWEILHTYGRLPPEHITRACLAAIHAFTEAFCADPALLDPDAPLPALTRTKRKD